MDVKNEKKVLDFITRNGEQPPSARDILRGAGVKLRKVIGSRMQSFRQSHCDGRGDFRQRRHVESPPSEKYRSDPESALFPVKSKLG